MRSECPSLLLVDEGFAALDPLSKSLVHAKLKSFCAKSLVLCIYHTDAPASFGGDESIVIDSIDGQIEAQNREEANCFSSSGFFDANLHFEAGVIQLRPLCKSSH